MNKYADSMKKLLQKKEVKGNDLKQILVALVNIFIDNPKFKKEFKKYGNDKEHIIVNFYLDIGKKDHKAIKLFNSLYEEFLINYSSESRATFESYFN